MSYDNGYNEDYSTRELRYDTNNVISLSICLFYLDVVERA